jgi:hypothetical protein
MRGDVGLGNHVDGHGGSPVGSRRTGRAPGQEACPLASRAGTYKERNHTALPHVIRLCDVVITKPLPRIDHQRYPTLAGAEPRSPRLGNVGYPSASRPWLLLCKSSPPPLSHLAEDDGDAIESRVAAGFATTDHECGAAAAAGTSPATFQFVTVATEGDSGRLHSKRGTNTHRKGSLNFLEIPYMFVLSTR